MNPCEGHGPQPIPEGETTAAMELQRLQVGGPPQMACLDALVLRRIIRDQDGLPVDEVQGESSKHRFLVPSISKQPLCLCPQFVFNHYHTTESILRVFLKLQLKSSVSRVQRVILIIF